jgi:hypothetical protein
MPALSYDSGDVALPGGQLKNHAITRFGLRKDNLVRIFDELTDDEAKELLHASTPPSRGRFLPGFVDDAADRKGRPCPDTYPVVGSIKLEREVVALFLGIIRSDNLDELSVARLALVCDHDFIVRAIASAFAPESDCHCHFAADLRLVITSLGAKGALS